MAISFYQRNFLFERSCREGFCGKEYVAAKECNEFIIFGKSFFMSEDILKLIETNPKVMFGKPVVKGTRIPVDLVLERLAHGSSHQQIMESFPNITQEHIYACLHYASLQIRNENIYAIAS